MTMSDDVDVENLAPKLVILFSGKRKSGKDAITDVLYEKVSDVAVNIKVSAPIKFCYSKNHGLDYNKMMGADSYKEQYRQDMIKWSEALRQSDYGYFCRNAVKMADGVTTKPVWIVTDTRRKTDLKWFREWYSNVKTVRVYSTEEERKSRGWVFTPGIDDQETECDLDSVEEWDIVINNNSSLADLEPDIANIVQLIRQAADG